MQSYETPILICYDGSPAAVRAIETAAALLGPRRAVVLDVASSMSAAESVAAPYSAMAGAALEETHAAEAARIADEGTEIARSSGFDAVARATQAVPTWEGGRRDCRRAGRSGDRRRLERPARAERSAPWELFAPGRRTCRTTGADRSATRQATRRCKRTISLGRSVSC
jgi:hypothetical protein